MELSLAALSYGMQMETERDQKPRGAQFSLVLIRPYPSGAIGLLCYFNDYEISRYSIRRLEFCGVRPSRKRLAYALAFLAFVGLLIFAILAHLVENFEPTVARVSGCMAASTPSGPNRDHTPYRSVDKPGQPA